MWTTVLPTWLYQLVLPNGIQRHSVNLALDNIKVPFTIRKFTRSTYIGPKIYNNLTLDIKQCTCKLQNVKAKVHVIIHVINNNYL